MDLVAVVEVGESENWGFTFGAADHEDHAVDFFIGDAVDLEGLVFIGESSEVAVFEIKMTVDVNFSVSRGDLEVPIAKFFFLGEESLVNVSPLEGDIVFAERAVGVFLGKDCCWLIGVAVRAVKADDSGDDKSAEKTKLKFWAFLEIVFEFLEAANED